MMWVQDVHAMKPIVGDLLAELGNHRSSLCRGDKATGYIGTRSFVSGRGRHYRDVEGGKEVRELVFEPYVVAETLEIDVSIQGLNELGLCQVERMQGKRKTG
jgi:hypothetical protein